mmetsp:Transcript_24217/g.27900  ORF Transcript_24217/g.27900 Transcript_24217/m.27900 type:complete len:193 (-) Transcript_24217:856-1434(-)
MQHSSSPSKQKSNEITYIRNKSHQPMVFLENACTETRMLEKRRQMFEISEALEHQKDEFARREDAFRRREDSLRKKDLQLQESLIKFNKFLQDNERKKTRAIKRLVLSHRLSLSIINYSLLRPSYFCHVPYANASESCSSIGWIFFNIVHTNSIFFWSLVIGLIFGFIVLFISVSYSISYSLPHLHFTYIFC